MTTHVLSGFSVTYDNSDNVTAVGSATLSLRYDDSIGSFSYSVITPPSGSELLPEVEIAPDPDTALMDGNPIPFSSEEYFGYIDTPAGRTYVLMSNFNNIDHIFQIGGATITEPTTIAEWNALDGSVTGAGQAGGSYAPGVQISLSTIPGITTFEAEVIDGTSGGEMLLGGAGDDTIHGNGGDDYVDGGDGNDVITLGEGNPFIQGSAGSDSINFTNLINGYAVLDYSAFGASASAAIDATINGVANTASIEKVEEVSDATLGTDTIIEVDNPMYSGWFNGGLKIVGTQYGDDFTIISPMNSWIGIAPGGGNDIITADVSAGDRLVRLDYGDAPGGVVANLATGTISNDGFGGTDTIIGSISELATGDGNDSVMGSSGNDRFILGAGTDTVDGAGGDDLVRYDRSQVDGPISANLATGTVTGTWDGAGFTHHLSNIENIRGGNFADTIIGDGANNNLRGNQGNDTLDGAGGHDTLDGGDGHDSLSGGDGHDMLQGGQGDDSLYGGLGDDTLIGGDGDDYLNPGDSAGSSETEYDVVLPGRGVNTVDFSQVLNGYVSVDTRDVADSLAQGGLITIDGVSDTGSIFYNSSHQTTFTNVVNPLLSGWTTGGLSIKDSKFDDVYDITLGANQWMQVQGNALGSSTYNVSGPQVVRLDYGGLLTGITADLTLASNQIDKGSGNFDTINGAIWEVRGGGGNDVMTGTNTDEGFIGGGGNNVMDGGGGFDRLRYSHDTYDSGITMNMNAGTVSGTWQGFGFSDVVSNMEHLVGSQHDDLMLGHDSVDELIEGDKGDDQIDGGGGNDTITGGSGADIFMFGSGDGNDSITDFELTDTLDVSDMGLTQAELNAAYNGATDTGGGAQVDYGNGTVVTFQGLTAAEIKGAFGTNTAPVATVDDQTLSPLYWVRLSDVLNFSDADGDSPTKFALLDGDGTTDNWWIDGDDYVDATSDPVNGYETTAATSDIWFQADPSDSTQTLQIRAHDGTDWSAWDDFTLTTQVPVSNTPPVATVEDQTLVPQYWVQLSDVMSFSDADGDTPTKFGLLDGDGANNNWWIAGDDYVDATSDPVNGYETTAAASDIWFQADASDSTQTLQIRANDGTAWGTWDSFALTTQAPVVNAPPVASVEDQTLSPHIWVKLSDVLTFTDANGDTPTMFGLYDADGANNNWWIAGDGYVDATSDAVNGYETTAAASDIWFQADASDSSQAMYLRAFDGSDWGSWDYFDLTTQAPVSNTPPVATVDDQTLTAETRVQLSTILDFSDADGDTPTKFGLFDGDGAVDNWYIDGIGKVDATSDAVNGYETTAAASDIWVDADALASSQGMYVRAFDGADWSTWDFFYLTTEPAASSNTAPTLTVEDQTLGANYWQLLDSSIFTFNDVDGDTLQKIEVWDDVDEDSWWITSDYVDATTGYETADIADTWFQGAAAADVQTLWVRGFDGTDWSDWDSFELTTTV